MKVPFGTVAKQLAVDFKKKGLKVGLKGQVLPLRRRSSTPLPSALSSHSVAPLPTAAPRPPARRSRPSSTASCLLR